MNLHSQYFSSFISRLTVFFNREIYDLQLASRACAHCTTPLANHSSSSLILNCPTTSSTTSSACPARFCNRLCLKRSEKIHPLLCPAQNPASVPLLAFAKKHAWMALHALAQCTARLLLAHQQKQGRQKAGGSGDGEREGIREDWGVYCALADLGMEERVKGGWYVCVCAPSAHYSNTHAFAPLALKGYMAWSPIALHGRLRTKHSRRHLWSLQILLSRKNSQSY